MTLSNGRTVSNPLATTIRFANATRDEGQFKLPALHILNLRFGRDFRFGTYRLEPALEIFNVTNHDAFYLIEQGGDPDVQSRCTARAASDRPLARRRSRRGLSFEA